RSAGDKLFTAVAGIRLKDAKDLDKAIRATVEKLPEAGRNKIKLDADSEGDVKVHRMDVGGEFPAKAKEQFGEKPIYFAVRDDARLFGVGENGLKALKEAVKAKVKTVPLAKIEMSLSRLTTLIQGDQKTIAQAAQKAFGKDKDDDKVYLTLTAGK